MATAETISVKLVKEVVGSIVDRVRIGNEEMRATEKEVVDSVRVLTYRSYIGKTWIYTYKPPRGKGRCMKELKDVILRNVSVYEKEFQTAEYPDGKMFTMPERSTYRSWRDFLLKKMDSLAVRHEVIPLGLTTEGVMAGKPQLEP